MESYRVLTSAGSAEITEKKSRFIASLHAAKTEEEAFAFIEEVRKKYWDARHNCYAYVVGENGEITRYSDDGEPGGTAGRPMLEVISGQKLRDIVVVVTRYFGGTLLGTGGLVRAYSQAVKEGLKASGTGMMAKGAEYEICSEYNDVGKILYLLEKSGIEQKESNYGADVTWRVIVPEEGEEKFLREAADATGGRAMLKKIKDVCYVKEEVSDR